jgi:Na+/melibiose symporter-like transporter
VNEPRKRPGFLWLLFYGRRRRGFPWLLAGMVAAILAFALLFAIPGGADTSRAIAAVLFGLLLVGAVVLAVVAVLRPRRRP